MSSLVVLLPAEPATGMTEWAYALTADRRTLAGHGKSPAALLPPVRGAGAEVVISQHFSFEILKKQISSALEKLVH